MKIAVVHSESNPAKQETLLAQHLGLPLLPITDVSVGALDYYLQHDAMGLGLHSTQSDASGAVRVDFSDGKLNFRAANATRNQNIVKAMGIRGADRPHVLDATAGLGKDAYLLASLGCDVQMLERSVIVHALLEDGLRRAMAASDEIARTARKLQLHNVDFLELASGSEQFDVVYLDPMFPLRNKSARVKKDMYLLQKLLGHDENNSELLAVAVKLARKRVVVKRAKLSPHISAEKPDIEFKGSSSRYDVYLIR